MTAPADEPDVTINEPDVTVAEPAVNIDEYESKASHHHAATTPRSAALPLAICATVIGVAALGLSIWGLVRHPAHQASTSSLSGASPLSPADAKTRVCRAFDTVARAVSVQTNAQPGDDPTSRAAVAANARLATLGGGQYLLAALDPATPSEIAGPARTFATALTDIGMSQLAGAPSDNPDQVARLKTAEDNIGTLSGLCK